ncbi:MAG: DUF192 domain-containing protein [Opitutus sp.]
MVKNANLVWLWRGFSLLVLAATLPLAITGCGRTATGSDAPPKTVADFFEIRVGNKPVRMQLAVRQEEMERGLMERRDLGENDGMLFVYDRPQQMSFWMRNTPTPLDIGFFNASGVLEEIYPLHPYDETSVKSRGDQLMFALETNQGWYHRTGTKPGSKLDLTALAAALKARGFTADQLPLLRGP